ncbi:MAG: hypothetical protein KJZ86_04490 [Caldilineaceae bacterium]|nr:hypothetical protein [Caldilineaceae bacterium]HRJ43201.1 hypothetical protein [Caldilineaceae bacterium]
MTPQTTIIMKKDLLNLLRSTLQTNERIANQFRTEGLDQYSNGFRDALVAIATACDFDLREEAFLVPTPAYPRPMLRKPQAYD